MDVRTLAAQHRASGESVSPIAAQLYERASFELNEEDIQALRKHFDSFARLNGVHCPCPRPEAAEQLQEYQRWQVGCLAILQSCVAATEGLALEWDWWVVGGSIDLTCHTSTCSLHSMLGPL